MTQPLDLRQYCVREASEASTRAHLVTGRSFEDAALHYLEDHHPETDEVRLHVEAVDSGERHCLVVDLDTGEASPCD